jgi:hypothetical protein
MSSTPFDADTEHADASELSGMMLVLAIVTFNALLVWLCT